MVGFCGVVGESEWGIQPLLSSLSRSDDERCDEYQDESVAVHVASHSQFYGEQPATAEDGSLIWIYGNLYGFEGDGTYEPRIDFSTPAAEYCAELFDEFGMDFVGGLNGEFSGLVFDRRSRKVHLFTDRLGSHPLFYWQSEGDGVLFSSRLQSIGLHPDVDPAFDREYLAEFFGVQKAFGTATPLVDVRKVAPGSIRTLGLDGTVHGRRTYWRPRYRPVDRSPAELARDIVDTLRRVFEERVRDDLSYGVLLSGGSDSRLVLGMMQELGRSPTAFHMTNWMSREARTAERTAMATGADVRLLRRDADYHERLLGEVPEHSNFVGCFDESIAAGFGDELGSVDTVLTGYLGDTMFGVYPLYLPISARYVHPRFERQVSSVPEYVSRYVDRYDPPAEVPDFLDAPGVTDVMREHIGIEDGEVRSHGVEYPSLRELQLSEYYPLTNQFASANSDSIRQITGHWSPFFDNRLIDLHLTIPVRDRIRYDVVNLAISQLSPSLASIEHAVKGVPLDESIERSHSYGLRRGRAKIRNRLAGDVPPAPYLGHGPWIDESELIRSHDFIEAAIERNADVISGLPCIDGDDVWACYREHLEGADNWRALYALVTVLETPVAERISSGDRSQ